MNYNSGVTGETLNTVNFTLTVGQATLTVGEPLLLRFYPSLTYNTTTNMPSVTAPTLATTYGQIRSSTVEFGGTIDPSETAWIVPAAGAPVDLDYITARDGGTYPDGLNGATISSFASFVVLAPIPEPSTYAMFGAGFMGLIGLHAWNCRKGSSLAT